MATPRAIVKSSRAPARKCRKPALSAPTGTGEWGRRLGGTQPRLGGWYAIEHDVFERQSHAALPNPDFHPGLVVIRRCRRCRTLDDRAWFATPGAAASEASRTGWSCRVCSGTRVVPVRAWFDTLYGTR
jgi:hypothetical protein